MSVDAPGVASSPKRFLLWAGLIIVVGTVALGIAWRQFLQYAEKEIGKKKQGAAVSARFVDFGRVDDFRFTNWDGREVSRDSLAGKVVVVDFVFTTCSGLCPVMSQSMARVQQGIRDTDAIDASKLRLLTISTDPETDTPERLAAYAKRFEADPELWYFARGDFAAVQSFSQEALKLGLERASPQQRHAGAEKIIHSNKFILLDARGHFRKIYTGTTPSDVDELLRDLPVMIGGDEPEKQAGQGDDVRGGSTK